MLNSQKGNLGIWLIILLVILGLSLLFWQNNSKNFPTTESNTVRDQAEKTITITPVKKFVLGKTVYLAGDGADTICTRDKIEIVYRNNNSDSMRIVNMDNPNTSGKPTLNFLNGYKFSDYERLSSIYKDFNCGTIGIYYKDLPNVVYPKTDQVRAVLYVGTQDKEFVSGGLLHILIMAKKDQNLIAINSPLEPNLKYQELTQNYIDKCWDSTKLEPGTDLHDDFVSECYRKSLDNNPNILKDAQTQAATLVEEFALE